MLGVLSLPLEVSGFESSLQMQVTEALWSSGSSQAEVVKETGLFVPQKLGVGGSWEMGTASSAEKVMFVTRGQSFCSFGRRMP